MNTLLAIHLLSTVFMTGVIWYVQLAHYPLFHYLDRQRFSRAMTLHQAATTTIVAPAMLVELATGIALLFGNTASALWWVNTMGLLALWLLTYLVSVPKHVALLLGYEEKTVSKLIWTNWFRTLIWSARAVLVFGAARSAWQM